MIKWWSAAAVAFVVCIAGGSQADTPVTVFAAASLQGALEDALDGVAAPVRISYASSATLARQIVQGAEADVYISANSAWMIYAVDQSGVDKTSVRPMISNQLVVVAPAPSPVFDVTNPDDWAYRLPDDERIAMGFTAAVPAGIYGRAALTELGLWDALESRVAETANVRVALSLVARAETPLGIVYASDAKAEPRVTVVGQFPSGTYPAIVYPIGRVLGSDNPQAGAVIDHLLGANAQAAFTRNGFRVID